MHLVRLMAVAALCFIASRGSAHYHLLLPDQPSTEKSVNLRVLFGHPFEHQLFDATKPEQFGVLTPDGKFADLGATLKPASHKTPEGNSVTAFHAGFQPEQRGDHVFVVVAPAIWMKEENRFYQDTVRVVVHHRTQVGWDNTLGKGFELVPLTRPYGLQSGMAFQVQAQVDGVAAPGLMVEVERFNPVPPKELPEDEQITRLVKTGPQGIATATLPESGWWCITARRDGGTRLHEGKAFPVLQRSTFWVYVDELKKPGK